MSSAFTSFTRKRLNLKQRKDICSGLLLLLHKYKSNLMWSNRSNRVLLIHALCYNLYTMAWGNWEHIRWGLLPGSLRFITYIWWWYVFHSPPHVYFLSEIVSFSKVGGWLFTSLAQPLLMILWGSVNGFNWLPEFQWLCMVVTMTKFANCRRTQGHGSDA